MHHPEISKTIDSKIELFFVHWSIAYVVPEDLLHVRTTAGSKSPRPGRPNMGSCLKSSTLCLVCPGLVPRAVEQARPGSAKLELPTLQRSAGPRACPAKWRLLCFRRRVPESPEAVRQLQAPSCSAAFSRPGLG